MTLAVTDHALVRWLERTGALDVAALRALLAKSLEAAAEAAGKLDATRFLILADGLVYVVQEGRLVTVVDEDGRHRHARILAQLDAERG